MLPGQMSSRKKRFIKWIKIEVSRSTLMDVILHIVGMSLQFLMGINILEPISHIYMSNTHQFWSKLVQCFWWYLSCSAEVSNFDGSHSVRCLGSFVKCLWKLAGYLIMRFLGSVFFSTIKTAQTPHCIWSVKNGTPQHLIPSDPFFTGWTNGLSSVI